MLKSLRLQNFKSFADASIDFDPLTILVGANASGKSNLLDAVRFLQGVALGMSLADVLRGRLEGGRQVWPGLRGGAADVVRRGASTLRLTSVWHFDGGDVEHEIECQVGEHPQIDRERLRGPLLGAERTSSAHSLLSNSPRFPRVKGREDRARLVRAMRSAYFLDITPSRMRGYAPKHMTELGLEGENVSALAWSICQDVDAKADLVDWLTELCAPELVDIDFAEATELGDVMLILVEEGGRRIPARSLSDGTLRFLGQLLALRTAPDGSLLLIEEIETGLHPTRAHLLVEAMEAATQTRNIQVIATTHSPLVLNALSRPALDRAVLIARPPDASGTIARHLGELPDFDRVCDRRGVDRMLASGWLERAL